MILIRSCRSISQRSLVNPSFCISFQRLKTTSTQHSPSPDAPREVPTPLILLSVPKWEGKKDGKSTFNAFIKHFTKEGWNVSCIDLDPALDSKQEKSSQILSNLESELSQEMRSISSGSGPFPPLLVSYGFSTLVAEQYVSSHPLSGLAMLDPPLSPSHAHQSRKIFFQPIFRHSLMSQLSRS